MGMYRIGVDRLGFALNGVLELEVGLGGVDVKGTIWAGPGTVALPAYACNSDPDTGMFFYSGNVNTMGFATGGNSRLEMDNNGVYCVARLEISQGVAADPGIRFISSANTGLFRIANNQIGFSLAGVERARLSNANDNATTLQTRAFADARYAPVSDAALKTNIQTMTLTGEDWVNQLRPVTYEWAETDDYAKPAGTIYGLIAQEVQAIYPNATRMSDAGLALDPLVLISVLVKAVQELSAKVLALENAP
jgi:hypothetical protein